MAHAPKPDVNGTGSAAEERFQARRRSPVRRLIKIPIAGHMDGIVPIRGLWDDMRAPSAKYRVFREPVRAERAEERRRPQAKHLVTSFGAGHAGGLPYHLPGGDVRQVVGDSRR
jgi:hypothetical protein